MPTAAEIRNEIARLKRQMREWELEGRLDADVEAEMQGEILDLQDELYALSDEPAGGGGLNVPLFVAAFGRTPEEEFAS